MTENDVYEIARWIYYKTKVHQSISIDTIPGREIWELVRQFDFEDNCFPISGGRRGIKYFGDVIGGHIVQKSFKIKDTINNKVTIWRLQ